MPKNSPKSLCTKCLIVALEFVGWVLVGCFLCGFWVWFGISCGDSFAFVFFVCFFFCCFVLGFGLLWEES